MKEITFILPGKDDKPVGGYKIVYEYANRFANADYKVNLIYHHIELDYKDRNLFLRVKRYFGFLYHRARHHYNAGEWFNLSSKINKVYLYRTNNRGMKKFRNSYAIATAIQTAYELNKIKCIPDERKFYFIQDFEAWNGKTDEYVYNSYKFPMTKIVIAPWLKERVEKAGNTAYLVPNGFDFEYFGLKTPIENRKPYEVTMLYHLDDRKRCCDSMKALETVKKEIPDLHVTMFGTPDRPQNLPEWYSYYKCPDRETHNKILNDTAVFVAASNLEGFGLTVGESMICGCAVACTDNGGFSCMAKNNETALTSPVYDTEALAKNIIKLIKNDELRIKIAGNGNKFIKTFTWGKAFNSFKSILEK